MSYALRPENYDGPVTLTDNHSEKRIGLMALGTDLVVEGVFAEVFRGMDAQVFVNRVRFENPVTMDSLAAMDADIERCLKNIIPGHALDVVAFGCSSGTVAIGEDTLNSRVQAVKPGAKTTNPVTAAAAAFRALDVTRISILTPYSREVNAHVAPFFLEKGLDVLNIAGFDVPNDMDIARITNETIMAGAREVKHPEAEAMFLSCTALRAANIAADIESELGIPVVTSNQAMAWHTLRLAGFDRKVAGFGRLFEQPLARPGD